MDKWDIGIEIVPRGKKDKTWVNGKGLRLGTLLSNGPGVGVEAEAEAEVVIDGTREQVKKR